MYHPTTRVLAVLALLRAHGRMTGPELARRLEVDPRTLRRYVTMLQDLGVPIVAERGRSGAYELAPDYRLPPLSFTNDEALALAIGLLAVRGLGLAEIAHAVESARAKLEQAMPPELKSRVRALTETVTLDLSAAPPTSLSEPMVTLSAAAQTQTRVRMRYRSSGDNETEREFDPYGLVYREGRWYAAGYCHLRRDLRSFRVDRVAWVETTSTRFQRPPEFDALRYLVESMATLPRRFVFEVLLKTDMVTAQAEIFHMLGVLEPRAGGILLRGTADEFEWVARQLAKFSFPFVVIAPDALREALRKRAAELVDLAAALD